MTHAIATNLDFSQEASRSAFECLRRELDECTAPLGDQAAQDLFDLGALFDVAAGRIKRELLASSLYPTEDDERLMAWIGMQHREIHEMGFAIAAALRAQASTMLPAAIASSLHHRGQAAKWCFGAARLETAPLHELMSVATLRKRHREALICKIDGGGRRTSIETLYFRALLLERFASGNLTRPQLEILDAWLWEWGDALQGEREAPDASFLRVDLDSDAGFRDGVREGPGPSLYLRVDRLEQARRAIVAKMQRGQLVPSIGCAAEMRIEDHLAVLDHLERAFAAPAADAGRAPRRHAGTPRVEVWVGLNEILARGINVGIETGRFPKLANEAASCAESMTRYHEATRRYFWLHDESETGLGFEALAEDARGIAVGDLVGWRRFPGAPVALGQVIRRLPRAAGECFFGVRLLSQLAQPLKLQDRADASRAADDYLFIPGADSSGQDDAFLLAENQYDTARTYSTRIDELEFTLRFNRVRLRARGWLLAGFELLLDAPPANAVELAIEAIETRPDPRAAPADDQSDDPWRNEVRGKLLD